MGIAVPTRTYRCLHCLDVTVERDYDVSHITVTCPECGEFGRFVHEGVYQQYRSFEEDPPEDLDWERLSRIEQFVVAEKMVREGKTLADFDIEDHAEGGDAENLAGDDTDDADAD